MTQGRYYIVYEWMVELGLTMSETAAFALVFSYTRGGKSLTAGSDEYSRWICLIPHRARGVMNRLVEKGLLVRTATRKGVLTYYEYKTAPKFDKYISNDRESEYRKGTRTDTERVHVTSTEMYHVTSTETVHNNERKNKENNQAHVRARATLQELMNGTRTDM